MPVAFQRHLRPAEIALQPFGSPGLSGTVCDPGFGQRLSDRGPRPVAMHEVEHHIPVLTEPGAQYFAGPPELTEPISQGIDFFICGRAFAWHRQRLRLEKPDAFFSYFGSSLQLPNWNLDKSTISFPSSLSVSFHILFHISFMVSFTTSFIISNLVCLVWYYVMFLRQTKEC